jgi:hypothetical protein
VKQLDSRFRGNGDLGIVVFGVGARKSRIVYRDRGRTIDATARRID